MADPGKLMGLAPYGKKGVYSEEIFELKEGKAFVKDDWIQSLKKPASNYSDFKGNFQYYANIAYAVQSELERAMIYIVNERYKLYPSENLCLAGGVALNAVANSKLSKESLYKNVYIQPAAADNGLSIGCAYYGWLHVLGKKRVENNGNSCYGKKYSDEDIKDVITNYNIKYNINVYSELIDLFFMELNKKVNTSHKTGSIIQFLISDIGVYQLKFSTSVQVKKGVFGVPNTTIKCESKDFINFMRYPYKLEEFIEDRKFIISGDQRQLGAFSNFEDVFNKVNSFSRVSQKIFTNYQAYVSLDFKKSENIIEDTASLLANGKIIGWFQDGSEFGPRSLGRRSILADPRNPGVRDFINSKIKFREDFRPFAPSVLKEDADIYFNMEGVESPYMIMVFDIREEWKEKIKSIVHENNTCRVQTVTPEWNKKYYDLLTQFKKVAGMSVLLNTSFNRRGMPIVETPKDAIDFFFECSLDYLIIGDYIISKTSAV